MHVSPSGCNGTLQYRGCGPYFCTMTSQFCSLSILQLRVKYEVGECISKAALTGTISYTALSSRSYYDTDQPKVPYDAGDYCVHPNLLTRTL